MVDVKFDESNGSQREQVGENLVDDEEPPSVSIFRMGTGEVMPHEVQVQTPVDTSNQDLPSSTRVEPPSSQTHQEESQVHGEDHGWGFDQGGEQSDDAQKEARQVQDDDDGPIQCQSQAPHPRVHQMVQRDHPVDNILGSIQIGVTNRSRLTNFCAFDSFVSSLEPLSVEQALEDPDWIIAMEEELNNFNRNEVWELVPRQKQNVIDTKWVFRNKQDEFVVVTKNKARLVGKGYTKVEVLDFGETYAPVARLESIRILLAYATHHNFKLHQMDIKSAFLNGLLQEEIYVEQPPGFDDPNFLNHVYKLHKALYGLNQDPRAWYECLKEFLLKNGFEIGKADSTLFIQRNGKDIFVCQIYVDDIIFGSTNDKFCEEFSRIMTKRFEMSMMGELKFFLGFQIKQMKEGTFLCQTKYVKDMLKRFDMANSKPIKTHMELNGHLDLNEEGKSVDQKIFRSTIGPLLYLCASRPEIMLSVCMCARFQANPKECHLMAVKRIFRYLVHTPNLGLWYPKGSTFDLLGDEGPD
jgi:hypothetical protein